MKTIMYSIVENGEKKKKKIVIKSLLKHIAQKGRVVINTNVKKMVNYPNAYEKDYCLVFENRKIQNEEVLRDLNEYMIEKDWSKYVFNGLKELDYNYYVFLWQNI